jgi:hypothetical protein
MSEFGGLLIQPLLKREQFITLRLHGAAIFLEFSLRRGEHGLPTGRSLLIGGGQFGPPAVDVGFVTLKRGVALGEATQTLFDAHLLIGDGAGPLVEFGAVGSQTCGVGFKSLLTLGVLGECVLMRGSLLSQIIVSLLQFNLLCGDRLGLLTQRLGLTGQFVPLILQQLAKPDKIAAFALEVGFFTVKTLAMLPQALLLLSQLALARFEAPLHLLERAHVDFNFRCGGGAGLGDLATSGFHRGAQR